MNKNNDKNAKKIWLKVLKWEAEIEEKRNQKTIIENCYNKTV